MDRGLLKFVIYARKSSEAKEKQALSIQDQVSECNQMILRDDLNVVGRIEESRSAFKPNLRPHFEHLLELIRSGQANAILTWKPDRLCRNPEEGGKLLQMLADGIIKEIRTPLGDVYTQDSDHLVLNIHFGMANQYSRNLSQNVKRGMRRKVHDRKQYPRPAPIGYLGYGDRGQRNIESHPTEAPLIESLFKLASTGLHSLSQLTSMMYSKGLRTKKGKKVSKSHIYRLLINPTYIGFFYYKGELCEGTHPQLVSKGTYDLVQEKLRDRSKPTANVWERDYAKIFRCGECGCMITTTIKQKFIKKMSGKKSYLYHHCTHRRGNCKQKAITDSEFQKKLFSILDGISIDDEVWKLGIELVKAKNRDEMKKNKSQLRVLQTEELHIRDQMSNLIEMRSNHELTSEEFVEQKNRLNEKLARVSSQVNDNSHGVQTWLEQMEAFFNTAFQAKYVLENGKTAEKQEMLKRIGQNFILKDKEIDITFQKPFDVLLQRQVRTDVLYLTV